MAETTPEAVEDVVQDDAEAPSSYSTTTHPGRPAPAPAFTAPGARYPAGVSRPSPGASGTR